MYVRPYVHVLAISDLPSRFRAPPRWTAQKSDIRPCQVRFELADEGGVYVRVNEQGIVCSSEEHLQVFYFLWCAACVCACTLVLHLRSSAPPPRFDSRTPSLSLLAR
jgi:hypothetical protein